jgi:2'-5' RNA ligase
MDEPRSGSNRDQQARPGARWFFAIWPDAAASVALAARLPALPPSGARPPHPDDLHLTLGFLGPLAPATLGCVEQAAARVRGVSFELAIDRVGHFRRARVLWCGPTLTPDPLSALVADLWGQLGVCGLSPDPRPYQAHITLARRVVHPPPAPEWPDAVRWIAREFVLAAGSGGPGPRYRIRGRWPLSAI